MSAGQELKKSEDSLSSQFDKNWFVKIFAQYPLLLKFVTRGIQTSTDGTDPTKAKNLTPWHNAMYEALREKYSFEDLRYHELERSVLSLIVFSVIRQKKYDPCLFFILE